MHIIFNFYVFELTLYIAFRKRENTEIEEWSTPLHFVLRFQENSMQILSDFVLFLVIRRILKALSSVTPKLLNSSDLLSSGSNSRKRYTLRLLLKFLGGTASILGVHTNPCPLPHFYSLLDSLIWATFINFERFCD